MKGTKGELEDEVDEHEMVDFLCLVMIIRQHMVTIFFLTDDSDPIEQLFVDV